MRGRQDNTANLNLKLTWDASEQSKFTLSHQGSWKDWSVLGPDYGWMYKDYPNSTAQYLRNTQNWNLKYSNVFSRSTIFTVNLGYLSVLYNGSLDGHSNPSDYWVHVTVSPAETQSTPRCANHRSIRQPLSTTAPGVRRFGAMTLPGRTGEGRALQSVPSGAYTQNRSVCYIQ